MKLVLLGAGIRTPLLVSGLIRRQESLPLTEVVLYDADPRRLETMGRFVGHLADRWGARFKVTYAHDFREAARGAAFIFSAIRVGQEEGRIRDEEIALKHGVLGQETTGPGGFAMALRTIPVMLDYARVIREVAPQAWLINFTNPSGLITQALTTYSPVRAIGICDAPTAMKRSVAAFLGVPADQVYLEYFGLNHLGWIRRVLVDGEDRMPHILAHYEELAARYPEWGLFEPDLVRMYGLLPNEYLYYFYYREKAVANILASGGTRGQQVLSINRPLWASLSELVASGDMDAALRAYEQGINTRNATYMARESGRKVEEAAPAEDGTVFEGEGYEGLAMAVMTAAVQRRKATLILNVPNCGALDILRREDVVEVTSLLDEHGARPLAQDPVPPQVSPLITAVKAYERLTVQAAVEGSYQLAVQALATHPLVSSYSLARQLVDEYLVAHKPFLPQFA